MNDSDDDLSGLGRLIEESEENEKSNPSSSSEPHSISLEKDCNKAK